MTFAQPLWFWGFAIFPLFIALFFHNERRRGRLLARVVAPRLRERLAGNVSHARRRWQFALVLLGTACLLASLAQPRLGYTWEESKRKGRDVLLAVDTSRSMLANDLAPNRLTRAKLAAQDLVSALDGDRVGLIAFAGTAFLQAPLTADYSALLSALHELDSEIIPQGGSNIAAAIKVAEESFGKGEGEHRALIIFSDGEEIDADSMKLARERTGGMRIFAVGVGTPEGSLIPIAGAQGGTDFVKDPSGQIVKTRLDEERLRKIAESTGGFYLRLHQGPAEMQQILRDGLLNMSEHDIDAKLSRQPIERYQWPLAAAIALLAGSFCLGDRRRRPLAIRARTAAVCVMCATLPASDAVAKNAGVEAYERQDYAKAAEHFSRHLKRLPKSNAVHFDLGTTAYKQGDFDQALEEFAQAVTSPDLKLRAKAEYNLANTLYQRGAQSRKKEPKIAEWKNALQHYDETLKLEPDNADAQHNRQLVAKLLAELEKEPPKSEKQQKKEQQEKKNDGSEDEKQEKKDGKEQPEKEKNGEKHDKSEESKSEQADERKEQPGEKTKGEQAQPKPGEKEQPGGESQPDKEGAKGDKSEPTSEPADRKLSGDLKLQGEPPAQPGEASQTQEEAAAANAKKNERMEAWQLLESLRSEEDRVNLLEAERRKAARRSLKDW